MSDFVCVLFYGIDIRALVIKNGDLVNDAVDFQKILVLQFVLNILRPHNPIVCDVCTILLFQSGEYLIRMLLNPSLHKVTILYKV